jgi:Domain of Unknown Function with PDB structure (DUF3857)
MNRTYRFVFSAAIFCIVLCTAPLRPTAAESWLPVPAEDLALKDNPASPGAKAMILYRSSDIDAKESDVEEYVRIKIFTQEGVAEGDVELPFDRAVVNIEDVHGRTIEPDGRVVNFDGKVYEKTLTKGGGYKYLAKTFTLPDVHPGCIIEYKYRQQGDTQRYISERWTITSWLYTRDARFTIKPLTSSYALPLLYRQFGLPDGTRPVRLANGTFTMDIHNIAGLENEEYMPPREALEAHVEFFYRPVDQPENETPAQYWKRQSKKWADEADHFVNKKSALDNELTRIVNADDSPETKLRKIYVRVQKIRNLSMENSKTQKEQKQEDIKGNASVEDVFRNGYATGRQVNFALLGLARAAGFSAFEVFVAARSGHPFRPELMDTGELGAEIIWVHAGTQDYYLDPSASTFPFGILPWYEAGAEGIKCSKGATEVTMVPPPTVGEATIVRNADLAIDPDGLATGKLQVDFTGRSGAQRREGRREEDETGRQKSAEEEIKRWLPDGANFEVTAITNWDNNELPLHVEGKVTIPNLGTSAGHRMLVPVSFIQARQAAAFHPEKRVNPIQFQSPYEEIDDTKIHVPVGYKIEATPPNRKVAPGVVSYEISATQQGDVVEAKRLLVIGGPNFPVTSYPALRAFFNTVKTDDDTQIVLQNAETATNR